MAEHVDNGIEYSSPIKICDFFWRLQLCSSSYRHGDSLIEFSTLWPNKKSLLDFLDDISISYQQLKEFCLIALRCGPYDVVSCLLKGSILPNNQKEIFGNYNFTMLHVAALAGNLPMMKALSQQYPSMKKMKDELGKNSIIKFVTIKNLFEANVLSKFLIYRSIT